MAYAVKYLFKFQSSNGTVREIRVLKDGYSGDVIQRPLGRAPVIKKEKNRGVHGTSLTFYAECHIDREYIEFYTSDPKEYRVDVYAGSTLLWQGYITPELYSEPDIAPPYDVQVVATDGVGELKLYDFAPQGTVTLRALLSYLLGYTGLTTDVNLVSSLKPGSRGAGALLDMQICVDYLAGKTCYEALTYILTTLHATITRWGGAWVLVRETNVTFTGDKVRYFNTSGNSALLTGSVQTLGAMRSAPAWPVGQLSTDIDPAKNKVVVQAPWHPVTGLTNPDMTSDTGWSKSNGATYASGGYLLPNVGSSAAAFISQTLSMAGLRTPTSFELRVTGVSAELGTRSGAVIGVLITYTVGSTVYLLRKGDEGTPVWQQGADPGPSIDGRVVDYQQPIASFDADRIQAETLSIADIPAFVQGTSYPSGTLKVYIVGDCALVYGAHLDVVLPKGYQDVLRIDNGARGEGDSVEIAIGRVTSEVAYYQSFLQGLLLDTGSIITSFSDANFTTAMDYLALISRDYALSAALPRALAKGTVYLESSIGMPPLVFAKGGLNYWLETWSWDLYEDELEIDARTLPSASLTVQSETILESDGSTVSSSSSGSSGGGSSISPGGGVTYFEPHNDGIILKADYDYVSVPDVLLGDDEESLTSLLAVIAGNAAQGAAAYGYFNNGVLGTSHLPALYLGTTQIQTSSAAQAVTGVTTLTMSGKLTIGGAEIEWVPAVGTTPGYLKINSALLTGGDQIVGGGTPGGGGGGGAQYLTDLLDVKYGLNPSADDLLIYSSSVPLNPDGTVTGPGWATIAKSSVGRIYTGGTGITIGNDNTISVTANTYAPYNSAGYLPLSGGTLKNANYGGQLTIWRDNASDDAVIVYRNNTGVLGHMGCHGGNGAPYYSPDAGSTVNYLLHSGNYSTYALPLTGGYIQTSSSANKLRLVTTSTNSEIQAMTSANAAGNMLLCGPGETTGGELYFKFSNVYAWYGSTYYGMYHSGNANLSTVDWNTRALYVNNRLYMRGGNFIEFDASDNTFLSLFGASSANEPIWYDTSWHTIYHTGNLSPLTTSNYTSYALPRSGGSSYPMTGTLFIAVNNGLQSPGSSYSVLYQDGNFNTLIGEPDSGTYIRSSSVNLIHRKGSTDYTIWDRSNSNLNTVDWAVNNLSIAGNINPTGKGSSNLGSASLNFSYAYANVIHPGASNNLWLLSPNNIYFVNGSDTTGTKLGTWTSTGLCVGADTPAYKLHVAGDLGVTGGITLAYSTTLGSLDSGGTRRSLLGTDSGGTYLAYGMSGAGVNTNICGNAIALLYGTSHTTGMSMSSAGVVRFNIPSFTNFQILRTASGGSAAITYYPANQTTNYWAAGADPGTSYQFFWYYNGAYKAYLSTSGTLTTTGDQVLSSDERLKTHIEPVKLTVEQIAGMRAVTYDRTDSGLHSLGVIAQDWEKVLPESVNQGEYLTFKYAQTAMVSAIILAKHETEQDKEIKKLKARVKELEARLNIRRI